MRDLIKIGEMISAEIPVEFFYSGFDSFVGLPVKPDYRDQTEIWHQGQLAVPDHETVFLDIQDRCSIFIGDMRERVCGACLY